MSTRRRQTRFKTPTRRVHRRTTRRSTSATRAAAAVLARAASTSRAATSGRRMSRSRRGTRVSPERRAGSGPIDDVIDLTDDSPICDLRSDGAVVDLTSPARSRSFGVNDSNVVVIGQTLRERSRARADLSTLILSSDSDTDDDLPELDIPKQTEPATPPDGPTKPQLTTTDSPMLSCPICMEDYKEIRQRQSHLASTTCGHVFCTECIKNAVDTHKQCPLCRTKLKHRNYHTLHL